MDVEIDVQRQTRTGSRGGLIDFAVEVDAPEWRFFPFTGGERQFFQCFFFIFIGMGVRQAKQCAESAILLPNGKPCLFDILHRIGKLDFVGMFQLALKMGESFSDDPLSNT